MANAGKQAGELFSREEFLDVLTKFLVKNKLPFRLVADPALQELLRLAQQATSMQDISLPSKDMIRNKV